MMHRPPADFGPVRHMRRSGPDRRVGSFRGHQMRGMVQKAALWLAVAAGFAACGPITLADAERQCFERARQAQQPRGEAVIGIDSEGGVRGGFELDISSDYLSGRDPAVVYETCVVSKSGEPPSRPLYARPDWKG